MNNESSDLPNSITLSYLKGQISFQEYESLIENQQLENEIPSNIHSNVIEYQTEGTSSSFETNLINSGLKPLTNRKRNSTSSSSSINNTSKKSDACIMDRFLNLQNIISSNEDDESDDDENQIKNNNNLNNQTDENLDNLDDNTTGWEDFDIETLNFDNYIKVNISNDNNNATTNNKQSKKQINNENSNQKRKRDNLDQNDLIEIKSKRRVYLLIFLYNFFHINILFILN
jgi:hypothetical protein